MSELFRFKGPVLLRRKQANEQSTTDQRLLDSRGPTDWVHTDPWRVLRIQAEFVEGFGALAELGPAIGVFGSARSWKGVNAIHKAAPILARLNEYVARQPVIDGLEYHEGLNAVAIRGGVAGNVIPDECIVEVNFRFAPDRDEADAAAFVKEFFAGYEVTVTDSAPGALPGLGVPAAQAFIEAVGGEVNPKFGWTDVARFTALGVPAVNYGPGDPMFAHKQDEFVPLEHIRRCEDRLREWLS